MANEPIPSGRPPGAIRPADSLPPLPAGAIAPGAAPATVPTITLPQTAPAPAKTPPKPADHTPHHHDSFREFIETIVFVVVLVLILKTFLAEAFVIPTGSMATTLFGYQKDVTCEQCGYRFQVNASKEADPADLDRQKVTKCTCPNCFFQNNLR